MTMGIIVAIGGGELNKHETYAIDAEIVKLTAKEKPKALFIPTASGDAPGYYHSFKKIYGDELHCDVDSLLLIDNNITREEIIDKINQADLIYVGGGNTRRMLEIWREHHVDHLLLEAYNNGTVLSGISAGSICWFEHGQSESSIADGTGDKEFIKLDALGILKGFHCPHFNEGLRSSSFSEMIEGSDEIGIALDNQCAIIFNDDQYKVVTTVDDANAYKIYYRNNQVVTEKIKQQGDFRDIAELYVTNFVEC
jgi:dipeptidase E